MGCRTSAGCVATDAGARAGVDARAPVALLASLWRKAPLSMSRFGVGGCLSPTPTWRPICMNWPASCWPRPATNSTRYPIGACRVTNAPTIDLLRNQPYLGVGAGAHSSDSGQRWWNVSPVRAYVDRLAREMPAQWPSPAAEGGEVITRPWEMGETLMLGLRLIREGVAEAIFTGGLASHWRKPTEGLSEI